MAAPDQFAPDNRQRSHDPEWTHVRQQTATHFMPLQGPAVECLTEYWNTCTAGDRSPLVLSRLKVAAAMVLLQTWLGRTNAADNRKRFQAWESVVTQIRDYIAGHLNEDLSLCNLATWRATKPSILIVCFTIYERAVAPSYQSPAPGERRETACPGNHRASHGGTTRFRLVSLFFAVFFKTSTGLTPITWANAKKRRV